MKLGTCAKIAIAVMGACVFGAGLSLSLLGVFGIPWRWPMFAESVIGGILSLMCALSADHGQMDATTMNTSTENR